MMTKQELREITKKILGVPCFHRNRFTPYNKWSSGGTLLHNGILYKVVERDLCYYLTGEKYNDATTRS